LAPQKRAPYRTPNTVGKTDRIDHGQEQTWDYALRGKK